MLLTKRRSCPRIFGENELVILLSALGMLLLVISHVYTVKSACNCTVWHLMEREVDQELALGALIVFSCEDFLNTIVGYRKHCNLWRAMAY